MHQIIINVVFYLLSLGAYLAMPAFAADAVNAARNAPLQCPAQPGLGPACATADSPWLLPLAGNPINLINGNKYTLHEDLPSMAGATLLFIQRHYNAQSVHHSILGRGWSLHWDIRLQPQQRSLLLADGRQLALTPHQLRRQPLPDTGFEVVLSPENILHFNAQGYLVGWHKAPHPELQLHRYAASHPTLPHGLRALQVGSTQLQLHYHRPFKSDGLAPVLLKAIQGPFGRINYEYEWVPSQQQARLQTVRYPDGRRLYYHYEDSSLPFALTGVSWQLTQHSPLMRMQYWGYDARGRAIYSARGDGLQWIRVDYEAVNDPASAASIQPAATSTVAQPATLYREVHSAQGLSQFFFTQRQGQWQLNRSTGPQCAGCPPTEIQTKMTDTTAQLNWPGTQWQHHEDGSRTLSFTNPNDISNYELRLDFDDHSRLKAWHSPLTGTTRISAPHDPRQVHIKYANGDQAHLQRDAQGRPQSVVFSRGISNDEPHDDKPHTLPEQLLSNDDWAALNAPIPVHFGGLGTQRLTLQHPNENQWWVLGPQQQLRQRSVHRHLNTDIGPLHWTFEDRFDYNKAGLLTTHHLFEGGQLHYEYDTQQQLKAIYWHPAQGLPQTVLKLHDSNLWEHHNGIFDFYGLDGTSEHLLLFNTQHLLSWHGQELQSSISESGANNTPLVRAQHAFWAPRAMPSKHKAVDKPNAWRDSRVSQPGYSQYYLHDDQGRLVGARQTHSDWHYWAWDNLGQHITVVDGGAATSNPTSWAAPADSSRDASGLLQHWSGLNESGDTALRQLFYNAQRRLAAVTQDEHLLARYQHDAFGQRIHAFYPTAQTKQHHMFIHHQQKLVAEWFGSTDELRVLVSEPQPHPIKRRYIYLGDQPVAVIDYDAETPRLYAVHSQFIGAPIAVSDDHQQFVWRAQYEPLGAAQILHSDFYQPLRLPGHYADPMTGWHDNLLRTYDPHRGHYLNPDPLGPAPGQQLLGYARQQPWQFIDPMGLLLFAFDGTRYDARLNSNVWKFADLYTDTAYYQSGPGNSSYIDWDAVTAWRAHQIVQNQWQHLLNEILWQDTGERLAIDVIGFSRGAALARHFGNEILQHTQQGWFHYEDDFGRQYATCLEPRFLGLFDTVAQFGLLGSHNRLYDLSVAPEWAWVAHAVALNEHRQLFPLYSIEIDPETPLGQSQVQAGFIGAHEDLGGGHKDKEEVGSSAYEHPSDQGDLAHIPLAWMIWQAQSMGLAFADTEVDALQSIETPLLHDARPAYWRYLATDRQVQTDDHSEHQWLHPEIGQAVRNEVESFIQRFKDWQKSTDSAVGTVDLEAYYQWLEQKLHWRPVPTVN